MDYMNLKNGKSGGLLVVSPFSLEDELYFNADYFLEDMVIDQPQTPQLAISNHNLNHNGLHLKREREENINMPMSSIRLDSISNMNFKNSPILMDQMNGHKGMMGKQLHIMNHHNGHHNNLHKAHLVNQNGHQNALMNLGQHNHVMNGVKGNEAVLEDYEKLARTFQNLYSNNMNVNAITNGNTLSHHGAMMEDDQSEKKQFKLPSSKSPIMEALVYCSINKFGIELKELNNQAQRISFLVSDFNTYYKQSCSICSKQSPSEDIRARMKALQRWFTSFPAWRELEKPFELVVRQSHYMKMHEIITKMVRFYSETAEI